jgi:diguanylate cyclase (GGDEF)-like protein
MVVKKDRILITEDDPSLRRILRMQLEAAGYIVLEAEDGVMALDVLKQEMPDLVLLDVMMPNMDGNTTCRAIRADRRLRHLPIIFLTAKSTSESKIEGLDEGANDYLTKPYDRKELLLRVKNLIAWGRTQRYSNPLTGLPGNPSIDSEVEERLLEGRVFAFLYVDMDYFKAYNDYYSYRAGDEVIQLLARVLAQSVEACGNEDDFVGHVGGDDFVVISNPERADDVAREIVARFDRQILDYYQPRERGQGFVEIENRKNEMERFPLVSVTIALVASDQHQIEHVAQLNDVVAELKRRGKRVQGSVVIRERRQTPPNLLRTGSDG